MAADTSLQAPTAVLLLDAAGNPLDPLTALLSPGSLTSPTSTVAGTATSVAAGAGISVAAGTTTSVAAAANVAATTLSAPSN